MKLSNTIFFIFLTLTITNQVLGQNKSDLIKEINETVKSVDETPDYDKVILENEEFMDQMTDNGGQLVGFYKKDRIFKIEEKIGVSYAVKTTTYYFQNEDLIFVSEIEEDFPYDDSLATLDYTKTEKVFEALYYFNNNELIKVSKNGKRRITENYDLDSNEKVRELKNSARKNKSILIKRIK